MKQIIENALDYAKAGYKIFSVKENDKSPATGKGFLDATIDIEQIKKWWTENPNYNIGLPMASNHFVAIDIDMHGDVNGFDNLEKHILANELSDLPVTVEANTANGGMHKIFKVPKDFNPIGKLTDGVDVKFNGYIVVEPSTIDAKQYEWQAEQSLFDMQPATLPDDWVEHLTKTKKENITEKSDQVNESYPTSDAETIAEKCNFIKHCVEDCSTLPEPDWKFGLMGIIAFCKNGRDYAHKWSKNYNGYSFEGTEQKFNNALKFNHPMTCEGIKQQCTKLYCRGCEHIGKIKSPIVLGYRTLEYEDIEDVEIKDSELDINFPIGVFPDKIQEFILNTSYVMDAPIEYFAVAIIAVTAFLINSRGFLKVKKTGWSEPAILWIALVGEPGKKKKTPVFKLMNRILNKIDEQLEESYLKELDKYTVNMLKYDLDLKNWKKINNRDVEPPIQPGKPIRNLLYVSDTTIEGLSDHQSENIHGIGIMRDELAGFIEGINKYQKGGGNEKEYYLSAFSGDDFIVSRKSAPPFKVKPYHNIFGGIQPSKVENLFFDDLKVTDGFTERFLFGLTDYRKRAKMITNEIDEVLKDDVETLMERLYGYFSNGKVKYFELDKDARNRLFEILDFLDQETLNDNNHELLQSYLEKIKTCIPRFALILHCLGNHKEQYVSINTIESAYKIAQYFINCFIKVTKLAIRIKGNSLEHYTVQWLKLQKRQDINPSQLYLSNKSRYKSIVNAKECLYNIANSGFGKIEKTTNGKEKWIRHNS